ncbi:MAG: proteasome assembly chaperone family protein [Methanomassiliicoccus sp.]|nr:proteasome assembly chaperone family protein [Methanomassiliicoccus sp.]
MSYIKIIEIEEMNLRGAYVVDGFPSIGLVGSIVANYLVNSLSLRQVAVVDSDTFPAVSMIKKGVPHSPVRLYAGDIGSSGDRMVVFVSEFQPPPHIIKELGKTIMDWVEDHKCRMIVSPEGISTKQSTKPPNKEGSAPQVLGIASTPEAREMLKANGIDIFEGGVIVGLSGVLLNEGVNRLLDVVTVLSEASAEFPDARAAAAVTQAINKLILRDSLDIEPLLKEAEVIEESLKDMYEKAGKEDELRKVTLPGMYG